MQLQVPTRTESKVWLEGQVAGDGGTSSVRPLTTTYDHQECGRVHVEYYNASHVQIGTDDSGLHCAPGNGKTGITAGQSSAP